MELQDNSLNRISVGLFKSVRNIGNVIIALLNICLALHNLWFIRAGISIIGVLTFPLRMPLSMITFPLQILYGFLDSIPRLTFHFLNSIARVIHALSDDVKLYPLIPKPQVIFTDDI